MREYVIIFFQVARCTGHGNTGVQNPKKANFEGENWDIPELFLLYAIHEISKCSQFCIFQKYIKFIELSKKYEFIKPFWICKTSWSKKKLLKNEPNTELLFFLFPDIS